MGNELSGVRAMLACPTYGPVEPACQKSLRAAMMSASNHGLKWAGDISTDRCHFQVARNQIAQTMFDHKDEADGILWVDSDIMLEPDSIMRLIGNAKANDIDFLTGVYHKKAPPYEPVIYHYEKDVDKYLVVEQYILGHICKIGACGFGFVWTGFNVIKSIHDNKKHFDDLGQWFPDTRMLERTWDDRPGLGEDFNFCDKARLAGIDLWVDTSCILGHMGGGTVFTRDMYLQWLKENGGHFKPPDREAWRG